MEIKTKLKKMLSPWYLVKCFVVSMGMVVVLAFLLVIAGKINKFINNPVQTYQITEISAKTLVTENRAIKQDTRKTLEVLKGTLMEPAIENIISAAEYYELPLELYLGISFAESSFKRFKGFNPWGIGANGPRSYNNWEHSVNGFSQLLKYYYFEEGLITPDQLWSKYQGGTNPDWKINVKKYYN